MFLHMRQILNLLIVKVRIFTKILFYEYIIDNLKSNMQYLSNAANNNCTTYTHNIRSWHYKH